MHVCPLLFFFYLLKNSFKNIIKETNNLDLDQTQQNIGPNYPDQTQHLVGPDLAPNCLQRLSADDTTGPLLRKRVKRK